MTSVRIDPNHGGIGDLLSSSGMQADLMDRAEAVKGSVEARGILVDDDRIPVPVVTINAGSSTRARALVALDHPAGLAVEAKYRVLVGSLGAAR